MTSLFLRSLRGLRNLVVPYVICILKVHPLVRFVLSLEYVCVLTRCMCGHIQRLP